MEKDRILCIVWGGVMILLGILQRNHIRGGLFVNGKVREELKRKGMLEAYQDVQAMVNFVAGLFLVSGSLLIWESTSGLGLLTGAVFILMIGNLFANKKYLGRWFPGGGGTQNLRKK